MRDQTALSQSRLYSPCAVGGLFLVDSVRLARREAVELVARVGRRSGGSPSDSGSWLWRLAIVVAERVSTSMRTWTALPQSRLVRFRPL